MIWDTLLSRAYVPYSNKPNACIVQGEKGNFYSGVRIENVSFPLTISSVQAACCICLSYGETPKKIFIPTNDEPQLDYWVGEFDCEVEIGELTPVVKLKAYQEEYPVDKKNKLISLLDNAVTENSDFPVSALLKANNSVYSGVNIEVSDWAKGLCAERLALCKAIADGVSDFESISVHTLKGEFSSPCGACRQVMFEHLPLSKTELFHADGTYSEHFIMDLLPFSFTSKDLRKEK